MWKKIYNKFTKQFYGTEWKLFSISFFFHVRIHVGSAVKLIR